MVLNGSLLNTQHYKVRIKGKVEQSREGVAPSPPLSKREPSGYPRLWSPTLLTYIYLCVCVNKVLWILGFNPRSSYTLMPPCLTLSIIMYGSKETWSNPGKGVTPSLTPNTAIEKGIGGSPSPFFISSSCLAISTDISDSFSPPVSLVHFFWQVLRATFCISTEFLYVGSRWSSWLCSSMWRGPQEYIPYAFVHTSAVSRMSVSSNLDSFRDGWLVAVQLLFCEALPSWLFQYCSQHSCVIAVKFFLHWFS